jgi:hypothetical protein
MFSTKEVCEKTGDKRIYYYSQTRIAKLVALIITFTIFILLVLPIFAMYKLTTLGHRSTVQTVVVLVVFTLLFVAAMSLLTRAKRHELFAASAAYCAVLVNFVTNLNSND